MAIGRVTCTCKTCRETFEKRVKKYNRREADSWEEWAKDYYDECPECFKKRIEKENAEKATAFPLPDIEAVSEKQRDYALRLRNHYVAEHQENVKKCQIFMQEADTDKFKQRCEEHAVDPQEYFTEHIAKHPAYCKAYACLTETNAGKLIETLIG